MFIYQPEMYRRSRWMDLLIRGWRAGHAFGIEVRVHLILIAWLAVELLRVVWEYAFAPAERSIGLDIAILRGVWMPCALFGSVFLHELGHCYGAWIVGGRARSILLWPLGGLATLEGSNRSPQAELLVTILGPMVNIVLAVPAHLAAIALQAMGGDHPPYAIDLALVALYVVYAVNYALFLFNMLLPLFPMDAGRVLRATLALSMPSTKATYLATTIGMWIAGVGMFSLLFVPEILSRVGLSANSLLIFIFIFGWFECVRERAASQYQNAYSQEDSYGGRSFYHDSPERWRRVPVGRIFTALGRFAQRVGGAVAAPFSKRPPKPAARVVEVHRRADEDPQSPKAKYFRKLRDLDDQLRTAIRAEDFARAEKIKEKIKALKEGEA